MDKSWMSIRNRLSSEYREGVKSFLQFAMTNVGIDNRICCPCMDCLNFDHHTFKDVEYHLIRKRDITFIQDLGASWGNCFCQSTSCVE
ncbi:hypothetical protein ACSBR1_025840 [Camellia fascicularis]